MSKKTRKVVETKKSKRHLRCQLTKEELLQAGKDLADRTSELSGLQEDKKRVVSDFTAKITSKEADISLLSGKVQSGYEYRMVTCTERLGVPKPDKKTVVRDDTKETVGVEDMSSSEMQKELIKTAAPGVGVPATEMAKT